ncbi:hypothetical protein [Nocardia sp. NBC_01009]|uniref:hypothetical protein n=1 Tax=Nocardia sp. NBC_01009 TaxID=2975996 RepID=UPI00386D12D1|nr:hypothetical protein OHA42_10900 [Nocardia sp. NBC_01009]
MWEWGRTVAEFATAATWTSWQTTPPQPTVVDPEFWAEADEGEGDEANISGMRAPIREYDLVC